MFITVYKYNIWLYIPDSALKEWINQFQWLDLFIFSILYYKKQISIQSLYPIGLFYSFQSTWIRLSIYKCMAGTKHYFSWTIVNGCALKKLYFHLLNNTTFMKSDFKRFWYILWTIILSFNFSKILGMGCKYMQNKQTNIYFEF